MTKLVLHTLGLKMDATGESCFPSVAEIVELSGLDKKTVLKHINIASEEGWIEISQHGYRGQRWKRNEYVAKWPERDLAGHAATTCPKDCEGGGAVPPPSQGEKAVETPPEGGGNDDHKVVEQLHQDKNIPENIPKNIPIERERERADGQETEPAADAPSRREFKRGHASWPTYLDDSDAEAWKAFCACTAEERREGLARQAEYVAGVKKVGRSLFRRYSAYWAGKFWQKLPAEPAPPPVAPKAAAPFGPVWSQMRFATLLAGPLELGKPETTRASRLAAYNHSRSILGPERAEASYRRMGHEIGPDGELGFPDDFEQRIWREHVIANGYPKLRRLDQLAGEGRGMLPPEGFAALGNAWFEAVPVGLSTWQAWQRAFERRMWPWLPDTGKQPVVFFPKGGPEGLAAFEAALRALGEPDGEAENRQRGNGDDAGRHEAAE